MILELAEVAAMTALFLLTEEQMSRIRRSSLARTASRGLTTGASSVGSST